MQIFVGSTNPVKTNAVTIASSETWPDVQVTSIDVPSGVNEQPIGDPETRTGARNRAVAALDQGLSELEAAGRTYSQDEVLGIGLEGGVVEIDDELWSTVWVVVTTTDGEFYESNGARFPVPKIVADRIRKGEEMGPIMNKLVGDHDVRRGIGMIGVITNKFVDRTEEYMGITKMAIGLWYGRDWQNGLR